MPTTQQFTRADVLRIVGITSRQLGQWERLRLCEPRDASLDEGRPSREAYGFDDIITLRTVKQLTDGHVPPKRLRRVLTALERQLGEVNPLTELRIVSEGAKITVEYEGARLEPLSGQLLLNFDTAALPEKVRSITRPISTGGAGPHSSGLRPSTSRAADLKRRGPRYPDAAEAACSAGILPAKATKNSFSAGWKPALQICSDEWMQTALDCEENPDLRSQAIDAYRRVIERHPSWVDPRLNLGTLLYEQGDKAESAEQFARAVAIDPTNPLAHFDLGSALEDLSRFSAARSHLSEALRLSPDYADAHYNLARVCDKLGDHLEARRHWRRYVELDPASAWATYARQQLGGKT